MDISLSSSSLTAGAALGLCLFIGCAWLILMSTLLWRAARQERLRHLRYQRGLRILERAVAARGSWNGGAR